MKQFYLFFILNFVMANICSSQPCVDKFIKEVSKAFDKVQKRQEKIVLRLIKYEDKNLSDYKYTFIPMLNYRKRLHESDTLSYNLFCYLDAGKIYFEHVLVQDDTTLINSVHSVYANISDVSFDNSSPYYCNTLSPLFDMIKKIKPDYIFQVYTIKDVFWYVTNNQMHVIYRDNSGYITSPAEVYLQNYSFQIIQIEPVLITNRVIKVKPL